MVRLTYQRSVRGNIARATMSGQTRTSSTISNLRHRERRTFFVGCDTLAAPSADGDGSGGLGIVESGLYADFPNSGDANANGAPRGGDEKAFPRGVEPLTFGFGGNSVCHTLLKTRFVTPPTRNTAGIMLAV